jgi:radical SAM superfamily enzyme YgiQ (UPF0313 family)
MKILLIKPPLNRTLITITRYEPLRIEKDLSKKLDRFKPNVVGATAYTCDVNTVKRIFKSVKQYDKNINTVIGGHHATFTPEDFAETYIDTVFLGYGDESFKEYINALVNGENVGKVNNIGIVENGHITYTEQREQYVDLNSLPLPSRHLTRKYGKKYFDSVHNRISLVLTSRGCPFRCTFCACWKLMEGKYKVKSNGAIIKDLKALPEYTDVVYFADDNTLDNVTRAWELGKLIKTNNIKKKFHMYARVNTIIKHPKLLASLREAGLDCLTVGFESISDQMLEKLNKKSTVAKNNEAIRILKKLGISIHSHFIIHPDFKIRDFKDLYQYICDKSLYRVAFPVLTPLPGTDLYDEVKDRIVIKDYDFFDFCHALLPTYLKREDFYNQLAKIYRKSYSPKRMVQFHYQKLFQSRNTRDFFAYHSDNMGFLKMLLVQIFGYFSYLKLKHAYRTEPVLFQQEPGENLNIPVSTPYKHGRKKKYNPALPATQQSQP